MWIIKWWTISLHQHMTFNDEHDQVQWSPIDLEISQETHRNPSIHCVCLREFDTMSNITLMYSKLQKNPWHKFGFLLQKIPLVAALQDCNHVVLALMLQKRNFLFQLSCESVAVRQKLIQKRIFWNSNTMIIWTMSLIVNKFTKHKISFNPFFATFAIH